MKIKNNLLLFYFVYLSLYWIYAFVFVFYLHQGYVLVAMVS